jgi:uncharacterized protein involved in exopolysaccharide biosynthesis
MQELELRNQLSSKEDVVSAPITEIVLAIVFRRWRLISITFIGVLLGTILAAKLQPNRYEASMQILVKRDRVDQIVTPDATSAAPPSNGVTEEELNSEVALLKGRDLLEQIVLECHLQNEKSKDGSGSRAEAHPSQKPVSPKTAEAAVDLSLAPSVLAFPNTDLHPTELSGQSIPASSLTPVSGSQQPGGGDAVQIARAVRKLDRDLKVEVVKKTNLIEADYQSTDPRLAALVLATLANRYIEKHLAVHRPTGAFEFFQRETQKYREELSQAQQRLIEYNRSAEVVAASLQKDITVQKLADLQLALTQTNAAIAETQERIQVLTASEASTPPRMVTQIRESEDGMLLSRLKENLLTLEQKRTELLSKFEPTYRAVQEVDAQIEQARAALAEKSQVHEQTTDRDPTYEWSRGELAKAKADLGALQARAAALEVTVRSYEENARSLAAKEVEQGDLTRTIKAAEEKYLLSQRKEEEARISDALDRGRILNVAIAEAPTVPALPSNHRLQMLLAGMALAVFLSAGAAFLAERADATFRTPNEVASILEIPVLAVMPRHRLAAPDSEVHT